MASHHLETRAALANKATAHGGRAGNPDARRDGAVDAESSAAAVEGGLGGLAGAEVPFGKAEETDRAGGEGCRVMACVRWYEGGVVAWCGGGWEEVFVEVGFGGRVDPGVRGCWLADGESGKGERRGEE